MLSMPVSFSRLGIEERLAKFNFVTHSAAVVAEELHIVVDQRVKAEGGRGKLVRDARIHRSVVAAITGDRILSQQGRQELLVGDDLEFSADRGTGLLIDLLVGPARILPRELGRDSIVLAHEKRLHRSEFDVFIRPNVAGQKTAGGIDGQQVSGAGFHLAAGERSQTVGRRFVRAVNHSSRRSTT